MKYHQWQIIRKKKNQSIYLKYVIQNTSKFHTKNIRKLEEIDRENIGKLEEKDKMKKAKELINVLILKHFLL